MSIFSDKKIEEILSFTTLVNKTKFAVSINFDSQINLSDLFCTTNKVNKEPAL
jgi:hypothetical protein